VNLYIAFLLVVFVLAGVAPKLMRRPWVLILLSLVLCAGLYSPQVFG